MDQDKISTHSLSSLTAYDSSQIPGFFDFDSFNYWLLKGILKMTVLFLKTEHLPTK